MTEEFYKDAEIFMTGGSGVLGKAGIEKLLRSCDVKKIYILVRSKKNVPPEDRLTEIKNSKIFRVLKGLKPTELNKLIAIPGDITQKYLGISEEHRSLIKNTSVVIHLAASTRFDLPLRTAIESNVKSTQEALQLAEKFENLKLFLHVSTFFSNRSSITYIQNKIYPPVFDWKAALKLLDSKYDNMETVFEAIQNKVTDDFPNTYAFTKNLAEQVVNDYRHKLPVAIYRPSIVMAAMSEPEPGFTETMVGVMGLLSVWGSGLIQVMLCKPKVVLDMMPLDACSNYMLIYLARTARLQREKFSEKIPIGNGSSYGILRHNFGKMGKYLSALVLKNPLEKSIWIPHVRMTACTFIYWVITIFLQILPAVLVDFLLRIFGQKPFMMKIQRQLYFTAKALRFFISNQFTSDGPTDFQEILIENKGTKFDMTIFEDCCPDDKGLEDNLEINLKGCRKFLLNEDDSSLPRCRKILKAKIFVYNVLKVYALYLLGSYTYRRMLNYNEL